MTELLSYPTYLSYLTYPSYLTYLSYLGVDFDSESAP
jgi:hypothetical protein